MRDRLFDYLRAVETGTTEKFHDYQDVKKGKLSVEEYRKKHGKYTGTGWRRAHD